VDDPSSIPDPILVPPVGLAEAPDPATGPPAAMAAAASASRGGLLRHPDFLRLWSAETVSQLGSQVSLLAIPFVAIDIIGASTFEVALLGVVDMLPFLLIGLPAGVWVDRLRRRPILVAGDLGRAVALATIPAAYALGALTIVQLYLVGFIVGVLTVFFDVAYQSYLPSLVERDQLVDGNAKLEISRAGAQVIGPGMAGVLIGTFRAPFAILLDAVSFAASALFILTIRRHEPAPDRPVDAAGKHAGMRREMAEGLRYVLGHRYLRAIAMCTATSNLFGTIAFSILLVFAVRELGMTAGGVGLAFSIGSTGALLGAFGSTRIARVLGVGPTIVVFSSIAGPAWLPLALAPAGTSSVVLVGLLALAGFVGGISAVVYNVNQVSLRQAITPERMQGRMNATMRWIVWGTIPIGGIIGGALGTAIGLRETVLLGAIGMAFAFVPVLFSAVRSVRVIPVEPEA
jgi:MFS family permease